LQETHALRRSDRWISSLSKQQIAIFDEDAGFQSISSIIDVLYQTIMVRIKEKRK
jgi:hypothetical protein